MPAGSAMALAVPSEKFMRSIFSEKTNYNFGCVSSSSRAPADASVAQKPERVVFRRFDEGLALLREAGNPVAR